ncbi:probable chitinase 2 [Neodiprion fabricii]|uniref:probable chitinase 2 n=1 Tax=Neodiprion fabricii TaxID=2872261 RepID=UPI001ED939F6|nr:probable chitinase 2 [Neodiprion fabricii]XP_046436428.1 probable chitinase 2 [Neodiprion fabricii]
MRLLIAFCILGLSWLTVVKTEPDKIVCYFGSWAVYRPGNGKIEISNLDPSLCTHMIYTFVGITEAGEVKVLDPWADLPDNGGKAGFQKFNALRERHQGMKTLVAIGGWNEGSEKYSRVAGKPALRSHFADNAVNFVLKYGFDGLDIDWEYPNQRGGTPADVRNFVLLLKELRARFDEHHLILTAAVAAAKISAGLSYDIPTISKYLHFINIMTYDFHGSWDPVTGHNAPLYPATRETTATARGLNVNASVHYWLSQGAPAEKLVLGTALYGRTFTLSNFAKNVPGSEASGPGTAGPYTRQRGMLGYNEICEQEVKPTWTTAWDEQQRVPYAHNGNQWVSYDNVKSITEKAKYAKKMRLGGAMVWSIETDDFRGICGDKYPLLNALNHVLRV